VRDCVLFPLFELLAKLWDFFVELFRALIGLMSEYLIVPAGHALFQVEDLILSCLFLVRDYVLVPLSKAFFYCLWKGLQGVCYVLQNYLVGPMLYTWDCLCGLPRTVFDLLQNYFVAPAAFVLSQLKRLTQDYLLLPLTQLSAFLWDLCRQALEHLWSCLVEPAKMVFCLLQSHLGGPLGYAWEGMCELPKVLFYVLQKYIFEPIAYTWGCLCGLPKLVFEFLQKYFFAPVACVLELLQELAFSFFLLVWDHLLSPFSRILESVCDFSVEVSKLVFFLLQKCFFEPVAYVLYQLKGLEHDSLVLCQDYVLIPLGDLLAFLGGIVVEGLKSLFQIVGQSVTQALAQLHSLGTSILHLLQHYFLLPVANILGYLWGSLGEVLGAVIRFVVENIASPVGQVLSELLSFLRSHLLSPLFHFVSLLFSPFYLFFLSFQPHLSLLASYVGELISFVVDDILRKRALSLYWWVCIPYEGVREMWSYLSPVTDSRNSFSLSVSPGNQDSFSDRHVNMYNSTQYSLKIANWNDYPTDCTISIDGFSVGTFRVDGLRSYTIERPIKEKKKFTFVVAEEGDGIANPDQGVVHAQCLTKHTESGTQPFQPVKSAEALGNAGGKDSKKSFHSKSHSNKGSYGGSSGGYGGNSQSGAKGVTVLEGSSQQEFGTTFALAGKHYTHLKLYLVELSEDTVEETVGIAIVLTVVLFFLTSVCSCCCCKFSARHYFWWVICCYFLILILLT